jgi:2-keto-myo-inositol isomerase
MPFSGDTGRKRNMKSGITRREIFAGAAALAAAPVGSAVTPPSRDPFLYGLNTSTLMGQKLTLVQEIDIAAKAGYNCIEPWIREIDDYVKAGGSLPDLKKRLEDHNLSVESAIGFFDWIVDDDARRAKALAEARRNMELLQKIGGKRLAAPPTGATDQADLDNFKAAERYRALLELGDQFGVVPQAEIWGFSKSLNKLSVGAMIAVESGHPKACVLPDVFHLYKGGSDFRGIRLLSANAMHNFHLNDYPASPPRDKASDADRVYPGDGVAPLEQLFRDLRDIGYRGSLSIELFNRELWKQDPKVVATTGLKKLKAAVHKSLA